MPSSPIPFRTDAAVGAASYGVAFAVTACLLLLAAGVLVFARRKGWVAISPRAASPVPGSRFVHVASMRLSPAVTVHTVQRGSHEYMVVEAARGVQVSVMAVPEAPADRGDRT